MTQAMIQPVYLCGACCQHEEVIVLLGVPLNGQVHATKEHRMTKLDSAPVGTRRLSILPLRIRFSIFLRIHIHPLSRCQANQHTQRSNEQIL